MQHDRRTHTSMCGCRGSLAGGQGYGQGVSSCLQLAEHCVVSSLLAVMALL